jgi:hypothetical protein
MKACRAFLQSFRDDDTGSSSAVDAIAVGSGRRAAAVAAPRAAQSSE